MRTRKDGTIVWRNLTFNPNTGVGYSYNWYRIADKIGDTFILNTYNYSVTTVKHWHKVSMVIGQSYVEIEAPNGLQDLKGALEHCILKRDIVEDKMASKKRKDTGVFLQLRHDQYKYNEMINLLLGFLNKEVSHE